MISLNQLKKTRSSVAALSTLIALQSLYAQSADAQVTFTSTIPLLDLHAYPFHTHLLICKSLQKLFLQLPTIRGQMYYSVSLQSEAENQIRQVSALHLAQLI